MHSSEEATFSHRWFIELRKTHLAWKGLWCPADKQSKLSLLAKWQTCLLNKEDRINYNFALRLTCLCCPLIVLTQITDILITNFLTVSFLLAVLHCRLIAQMYTLSAESHANYHYQHLQPPSSEVLRIPHPFPHSSILAVCSSPPILHTSHTHTVTPDFNNAASCPNPLPLAFFKCTTLTVHFKSSWGRNNGASYYWHKSLTDCKWKENLKGFQSLKYDFQLLCFRWLQDQTRLWFLIHMAVGKFVILSQVSWECLGFTKF